MLHQVEDQRMGFLRTTGVTFATLVQQASTGSAMPSNSTRLDLIPILLETFSAQPRLYL
jgi:hypothetical protein